MARVWYAVSYENWYRRILLLRKQNKINSDNNKNQVPLFWNEEDANDWESDRALGEVARDTLPSGQ